MDNKKFIYDIEEKQSIPQSHILLPEDNKAIDFQFDNFTSEAGAAAYNFTVQLSPRKKQQIEQTSIIIKDKDSSKILFVWDANPFHFDVTWAEYESLPEERTRDGSNYVYFITDIGPQSIDEDLITIVPEGYEDVINQAILLIKRAKDIVESQS